MDKARVFSIAKARKMLGSLADNVSDEQIQKDTLVAEVIKNLFFQLYVNAKKLPDNYNKS